MNMYIITINSYCCPEIYLPTNRVKETLSSCCKITSFFMFVYTYPTLIQEGFKVANRGGK